MGRWIVRRDGQVLAAFDLEQEAFAYLHRVQSSSWDHAIKHEGYSLERPDGTFVEPYSNRKCPLQSREEG